MVKRVYYELNEIKKQIQEEIAVNKDFLEVLYARNLPSADQSDKIKEEIANKEAENVMHEKKKTNI